MRTVSVASSAVVLTLVASGCGPREPRTEEEKMARGRELVQQMSTRLAEAPAFRLVTRETRERVKRDGTKQTLSLNRETSVRRPDRLHSKTTGDVQNELFYDGVGLTLVMHNEKIFGQSRMPEALDGMIDAIAERYGVSMPAADLVYSNPARALLTDTTKGGYVGREDLDGTPTYHLAFTDEGVAWDLWLPVEGEPLPRKLRVVRTAQRGQPVSEVNVEEWDLEPQIDDAIFDAKVPADYEGVALIQRARVFSNRPAETGTAPK